MRIQTLDGGRISVEDDGCGVDHLEVAVAEGASAWGETVRRREHVAGLGLGRLLDSRAQITTRVAGGAGRVVEPEKGDFQQDGRSESRPAADAPVGHGTRVEWTPGRLAGREHRNQLEIAPKTAADWDLVLGEAISEAVEYYPLPVTLNGVPAGAARLPGRRDAGARGRRDPPTASTREERNRDPLNVYGRGLLLAGMGPRVWTIDGRTFLTAIDVAGGHVPPLQEPDRWELAETVGAERLRKEGRLACLRAIAGLEQQPPLGYRDYGAPTEARIGCRPAPARLLPWRGEPARGRRHRWSPQSAAERVMATDGIVVERSFPQHEEATLLEAMRTSGNDAMLLDSHHWLEGYPWYDSLPRLEHMRVEGRLYGRTLGEAELCEAWSTENAPRLEEAHVVLTIRSGQMPRELADTGRGPAGAQDATRQGVGLVVFISHRVLHLRRCASLGLRPGVSFGCFPSQGGFPLAAYGHCRLWIQVVAFNSESRERLPGVVAADGVERPTPAGAAVICLQGLK